MNTLIQELASQAHEYARSYVAECKHYGYYMEHNELEQRFEQKFAELLIRECVDVLMDVLPAIVLEAKDGVHPVWHVKEHFGVEE